LKSSPNPVTSCKGIKYSDPELDAKGVIGFQGINSNELRVIESMKFSCSDAM